MNKKLIAVILCLTMLITLLAGCQNESVKEPEIKKVTNVYKSDMINLPEKCSVNSQTMTMNSEGRLFVLGEEVIDEETWTIKPFIYSFDVNGENVEMEYIEIDGVENNGDIRNYVSNYLVSSNGYEIYNMTGYNMETQESTRALNIYDPSGNLVSSVDPKTYFQTQTDPSRFGGMDYFYINYVCISTDDVIYMASDIAVVAVSLEGTKLFEIPIDSNYVQSLMAIGDGKVMIMYHDYNTFEQRCCEIDPVKKALSDPIELAISSRNINSMFAGPGYDIYYSDSSNVYGYNIGEEPVTLMNMINSDINPNSIGNGLFVINENKFVYAGYDYLTGNQQFSILTRIPDDEVVPKKIINMAFLYGDTYTLGMHVINFNKTNDEYRIIMTDYGAYNTDEDYEAGQTKFNNDILSANIPDIMILNANLPLQDYISKGLFADLYGLMDNSGNLNKDNLLKCVKNAYEVNGKLYQLPSTLDVQTLTGFTSVIGEKEGWTIDEMMALLEANPNSYLTPYANKGNMFGMVMAIGINDFIDYDKGICSFDSEGFINLLNYINTFDEKSYSENLPEDAQMEFWNGGEKEFYIDGTFLLKESYLNSFSQYLALKVSYNNEPITLKGFPSSSSNGAYISSFDMYTISDKSAVKEGAMDFLNYAFSDAVLSSEMGHRGFPSTISGFNKIAEEAKKYHYYMDPDGRGYGSSEQEWEDGTLNGEIHMQVTDEDIAFLRRYLDDITVKLDFNNKIMEIVNEDIGMFLAGEKSAEETAKVIQSRAQIYLSENS
jgi:hypothetical protein